MLQMQRALLLLGGPDAKWNPRVDDDNPCRFYEDLPTGPCKGKTASHAGVKRKVQRYYEQAGWDLNGIPTSETLTKLNLSRVDDRLEKLHD